MEVRGFFNFSDIVINFLPPFYKHRRHMLVPRGISLVIDIVVNAGIAYTLSSDGIYAIERVVHSDAAEKAAELAQGRRKLARELSDLRKKLKDPNEQVRGEEIDRQIDEMTGKISELVAAEDKRLIESSYKWHYRREGLASVIMAGDCLFVGGEGVVVGIDAGSDSSSLTLSRSQKPPAMPVARIAMHTVLPTHTSPEFSVGR